ncbi:MAG: YciI family protein [Owenweeksia sp.]
MKDFMLIFLGPSYADLNLSPEEIQERMGKWFAWSDKMAKAGILVGGNALTDTIKRMSGPDQTVSDVTSSEVKELIGGYYVVKARNFDEALEVARDYPDFDQDGSVEVREVMVFDQQ